MTKMMAFNLDDYFPLCPFHVPSGIPVEFHIVLVEFRIILVECCQQSCKLFCKMAFNLGDYLSLCPFHVLKLHSNSNAISSEIQKKF